MIPLPFELHRKWGPRIRMSKYTPHQGKREKMRRRIGGFHTILWHEKHGIPLSDRLTKELAE